MEFLIQFFFEYVIFTLNSEKNVLKSVFSNTLYGKAPTFCHSCIAFDTNFIANINTSSITFFFRWNSFISHQVTNSLKHMHGIFLQNLPFRNRILLHNFDIRLDCDQFSAHTQTEESNWFLEPTSTTIARDLQFWLKVKMNRYTMNSKFSLFYFQCNNRSKNSSARDWWMNDIFIDIDIYFVYWMVLLIVFFHSLETKEVYNETEILFKLNLSLPCDQLIQLKIMVNLHYFARLLYQKKTKKKEQ